MYVFRTCHLISCYDLRYSLRYLIDGYFLLCYEKPIIRVDYALIQILLRENLLDSNSWVYKSRFLVLFCLCVFMPSFYWVFCVSFVIHYNFYYIPDTQDLNTIFFYILNDLEHATIIASCFISWQSNLYLKAQCWKYLCCSRYSR